MRFLFFILNEPSYRMKYLNYRKVLTGIQSRIIPDVLQGIALSMVFQQHERCLKPQYMWAPSHIYIKQIKNN